MFTAEEIETIGKMNYDINNIAESFRYAAPEVRAMWEKKLAAALDKFNNFTAPLLIRIKNS